MRDGAVVQARISAMRDLDGELTAAGLDSMRAPFAAAVDDLAETTAGLLARFSDDPRGIAAAATPYLRLFGTVAGAEQLVRAACAAQRQLDAGQGDADFLRGKLACARFYTTQLCPQTAGLRAAALAGADTLFELAPDQL